MARNTTPETEPGEMALLSDIRLELSRRRVIVWRNNVGMTLNSKRQPIRFGLANESSIINARLKSSDLIGISPLGKFLAIEVKAPGWRGVRTDRERAQLAFIQLVRSNGGLAGFAQSVDEALDILRGGPGATP